MELYNEDTDVDSQPTDDEDINRLLYVVPDNETARNAMLELRDKLNAQSADPSLDHHRLYAKVNGDLFGSLSSSAQYYTSTSGSDGESLVPESEQPWDSAGHYELNYLHPAARIATGWTLGRGRSETSALPVDLSVPLPRSSGVHSYHCGFQFSDSGQLQITAFHRRVCVDHIPVDAGTSRVLHRPQHRLQVGPCQYRLTFAPQDDLRDAHQRAKRNYLNKHYPQIGIPHDLISATPSKEDQYINDDWKISSGNAIGTGAGDRETGFIFVQAASHTRENKVRALKERRRIDERGARAIQETERVYHRLDRLLQDDIDREYVERLEEILYSGSDRVWSAGVKDKVYHLFSPLGNGNFRQFLARRSIGEAADLDRLILFVQVILGMASLHRAKIVHRDIKPENLVIVLSHPPKAVIIDFGQACFLADERDRGMIPTPGRGGTLGYLAPEQENAAFSSTGMFSCPVDVFALGLVGIDIFPDPKRPLWPSKSRVPNPFRSPVNHRRIAEFDILVGYLRAQLPGTISHLLGRMLEKSPDARITAAEALSHPALVQAVQDQHDRREGELAQDAQIGSKRALETRGRPLT